MMMAERYDVKDTPLAAIISGLFVDIGWITNQKRSRILDRCAVRRQRKQCRLENMPTEKSDMTGLYFDGKIDVTIQKDGTKKKEEHITMLNEPGGQYLCHAVSDGHKALDIFNSIKQKLGDDIQYLKVLGADGTNTNTGRRNGALSLIENHIHCKCHWNVSIYKHIHIIYIYYF